MTLEARSMRHCLSSPRTTPSRTSPGIGDSAALIGVTRATAAGRREADRCARAVDESLGTLSGLLEAYEHEVRVGGVPLDRIRP